MYWKITEGYLRSEEIEMSDSQKIRYVIHDSSQRSDFPSNRYAAIREVIDEKPPDRKIDEGYLDKSGYVICGSAMFCATGLPKTAQFESIIKAVQLCEDDLDDIQNGIVRNFVNYNKFYGINNV